MKKKFAFLVALMMSFNIEAKSVKNKKRNPSYENNQAVQVQVVDPHAPVSEFKGEGYEVHGYNEGPTSSQISIGLRDQLLLSSGAYPYVRDWDHLEKDFLILRLQNHPIEKVLQQYPKIPPQVLFKLKKSLP